jgi:hypothetical protein
MYRPNIKAAVALTEKDIGLAIVRSYVVYRYDIMDRSVSAYLVKEVEMPMDEVGLEGQAMVARQQTSEEERKHVPNVSCMDFLEMMGEYNKVGHLSSIEFFEDEVNEG